MKRKYTILILITIFILDFTNVKSQDVNYFAKEKKGKYAFINKKGKAKTKYIYNYAEDFSEGYGLFEENLKFGYVNSDFDIVIPATYEDAGAFNYNLAYVRKEGKYGYINKKNEIVIECQYDYAANFIDGFAIVRKINPDTSVYGKHKMVMAIINIDNKLLGNKWFGSIKEAYDGKFHAVIKKSRYYIFTDGHVENLNDEEEQPETEESEDTYVIIDQKPEFPGGGVALMTYISKNTKYPNSAKENGISGKLYVKFIISKTGEVTNVTVLNPVNPIIDKEAMRVVRSMPNWKPGIQKGEAVRVQYIIPIKFNLH